MDSNIDQNPTSRNLLTKIDPRDALRTLFVTLCAVLLALGVTQPTKDFPAAAVAGLIAGCFPIAVEAWGDIRHARMSMELSMLIAIVAAAAIGEWLTALVVTAFVLAAEILEDLSVERGHDALTDLMAFLPQTVRIREGESAVSVPLADVEPGNVVIVSPGGRIPVDGVVTAGESSVDQSRITGEPLPADVGSGDAVFAGSINLVGALEVCAERVGGESSYGKIVEAIRQAQSSRAPVVRLADRFAAYLVYIALAAAAATYVATSNWTTTISVVVVAGACGIAAGTPLAVLAASARAAHSGAFVKDGAHLEALSEVETAVFDKTGTLTSGAPSFNASTSSPESTKRSSCFCWRRRNPIRSTRWPRPWSSISASAGRPQGRPTPSSIARAWGSSHESEGAPSSPATRRLWRTPPIPATLRAPPFT